MNTWKILLPALALTLGATPAPGAGDDPAPGTLVVVDAAGKEHKLRAWKFTAGTRRLSWLAPPAARDAGDKKAPKPAEGPEALELRAGTDFRFAEGVLTLIPLDRLKSVEFDNDKHTMTVHAAGPGGDESLVGTTEYKGINKVTLEAEVDKGDLGVAEVKYLGGVPRGIRAIRFPAPKAAPAPAGRPATVVSEDKKKTTHKVTDLQPLYRLPDGTGRLLPTLMFKKTLKLDLGKITRITASEGNEGATSWQVVTRDGTEETLTLLKEVPLEGKTARLEGFVGRAPAGYLLVPVSSVVEVKFDEGAEKKPEDK